MIGFHACAVQPAVRDFSIEISTCYMPRTAIRVQCMIILIDSSNRIWYWDTALVHWYFG